MSHRPRENAGLAVDNVGVLFRLPTIADLMAVAGLADAAEELARKCIRGVVSVRQHRLVETAMEAIAPSLTDELQGVCPGCGAEVRVLFDPRRYCLDELRGRAAFIYQDIDVLAYRYHWTESDIIALPHIRRMNYAKAAQQRSSAGMKRASYLSRLIRGAGEQPVLVPPRILFRPTAEHRFTEIDTAPSVAAGDLSAKRASARRDVSEGRAYGLEARHDPSHGLADAFKATGEASQRPAELTAYRDFSQVSSSNLSAEPDVNRVSAERAKAGSDIASVQNQHRPTPRDQTCSAKSRQPAGVGRHSTKAPQSELDRSANSHCPKPMGP